jgi:hypothetical protein
MDKQEIIKWSTKHDNEYASEIAKERETGCRLRIAKEVTKHDLIEIIKWKFDGFEARKIRELKLAATIDETSLKEASNKAFNLNTTRDAERIELLCELRHGIGIAVASTILTFFDPKNYGVFDFHVWQEVFGGRPKYTVVEYVKLLSRLRQEAEMYGLNARTIEKGYFKKNYDESLECSHASSNPT